MSQSMIRSFIAIDITDEIRDAIGKVSYQIKANLPGIPLRWVAPQNIHLTLRFLGEISQDQITCLVQNSQAVLTKFSCTTIGFAGIGAFPSSRRARIIWIGINSSPELSPLILELNEVLATCQISKEDKLFSPHLTLCRLRNLSTFDYAKVNSVLSSLKVGSLGSFQVDSVKLYKSDLTPTGPVYTCIHNFLI